MTTTGWWLIAFGIIVIIFIGYDIFAYIHWGVQATFSTKIANAAKADPLVAWIFGLVMGGLGVHFFGS